MWLSNLDSSLWRALLTLEMTLADLSFFCCFFCYCGEELANWKNPQTEIFFATWLAILFVTTK